MLFDQLSWQGTVYHSPFHQRFSPLLPHCGLTVDYLVHARLGKARLVTLIVAIAPIADQVDQKILLKLLPVRNGQASHFNTSLRIIGINVHNRDIEAFCQVTGIACAAP